MANGHWALGIGHWALGKNLHHIFIIFRLRKLVIGRILLNTNSIIINLYSL